MRHCPSWAPCERSPQCRGRGGLATARPASQASVAQRCGSERTRGGSFQFNTRVRGLCSPHRTKSSPREMAWQLWSTGPGSSPDSWPGCGRGVFSPEGHLLAGKWPHADDITKVAFCSPRHLSHTGLTRNLGTHPQWLFWLQTDYE